MLQPKSSKKKEGFSYFAPDAQDVLLVGSFNGWGQNPIHLKRQKDGSWRTNVSLDPGAYEYRFLVDGEWRDDPDCTTRVSNPYGAENCIRVVDHPPVRPTA
jgi:1,4-alpha-glucan branching enzyme